MATKIKYLGIKERASFHLCPTVIFNGNGDVQAVPDSVAEEMLKFPCYELAEKAKQRTAADPVKTDETKLREEDDDSNKPPMVNLETMDKAALREYAQRYFNHEFHHLTGEVKMRETIIGLMNKG